MSCGSFILGKTTTKPGFGRCRNNKYVGCTSLPFYSILSLSLFPSNRRVGGDRLRMERKNAGFFCPLFTSSKNKKGGTAEGCDMSSLSCKSNFTWKERKIADKAEFHTHHTWNFSFPLSKFAERYAGVSDGGSDHPKVFFYFRHTMRAARSQSIGIDCFWNRSPWGTPHFYFSLSYLSGIIWTNGKRHPCFDKKKETELVDLFLFYFLLLPLIVNLISNRRPCLFLARAKLVIMNFSVLGHPGTTSLAFCSWQMSTAIYTIHICTCEYHALKLHYCFLKRSGLVSNITEIIGSSEKTLKNTAGSSTTSNRER